MIICWSPHFSIADGVNAFALSDPVGSAGQGNVVQQRAGMMIVWRAKPQVASNLSILDWSHPTGANAGTGAQPAGTMIVWGRGATINGNSLVFPWPQPLPNAAGTTTGGWVFKKHRGRYVAEIDGQRLQAPTVERLEAMVAAYRKSKAANDAIKVSPPPKPRVSAPSAGIPAAVPIASQESTADLGVTQQPALRQKPAPIPQFGLDQSQLIAAASALAAQHAAQSLAEAAERARADAEAKAIADEEADLEALLAILMEAA